MPPRGRSDPGQGSGPSRFPGTFRLAFQEAAVGVGWTVLAWRGEVVTCREADGHEHVVGVDNLYRRARLEPRTDWPELITGFLRSVQAAESAGDFPTELSVVADRLLIRLGRAF